MTEIPVDLIDHARKVGSPCLGEDWLWWTSNRREDQMRAARGCDDCPLFWECRSWAMRNRAYGGVWGGMTEREMKSYLRRTGASLLDDDEQLG